jgi:DNA-binding response OmpR family regulator
MADDEPRLLHIVAMYLTMEGFSVACAHDGQEALDLLDREEFDLAVLDVMMPRCSGLEVCRRIRSNSATASLPVLVFTSLSSDEDIEEARQAGANHFVSKPFSLPGLGRVIRQLFTEVQPLSA